MKEISKNCHTVWLEGFIRQKNTEFRRGRYFWRNLIWCLFRGCEKNDLETLESISSLVYTSNEPMILREGKKKNTRLWGELGDFLPDRFLSHGEKLTTMQCSYILNTFKGRWFIDIDIFSEPFLLTCRKLSILLHIMSPHRAEILSSIKLLRYILQIEFCRILTW